MVAAARTIFSAACRARAQRGNPKVRASLATNTRPTTITSSFHSTRRLQVVKPFILADVGEGNVFQVSTLSRPDKLQGRENAR